MNTDGRFNTADNAESIFRFTRNNSLIKLEWDVLPEPLSVGFHPAGRFPCSARQTIGEFLLHDDSLKGRAVNEAVKFKAFSKTVLFSQEIVPFSSISNGDLLSAILLTILDQTVITRHLTVTAANISVGIDATIDDKAVGDLENKTVYEALKKILLFSNSVLYIDINNNVIVTPRTASATSQFTFNGPESLTGTENIIDLFNYRSGLNQVFNFITVKDTSVKSRDESSITKFGIRKKEVQFLPVTNTAKRQAACDAVRDEFGSIKQEMFIRVPMNYPELDLKVLDKVNVDYPARVVRIDGQQLALYGSAEYDVSRYAEEVKDIEISTDVDFKILKTIADWDAETITYEIREV